MSEIFDSLPDRPDISPVWTGVVNKDATDYDDLLEVVIPGLDSSVKFDGCRWMPRETPNLFPSKGDKCLALFDDNNEPWVVAWWPF